MSTKAQKIKAARAVKYSTRVVRRCELCGRPRGVLRKFRLCRICLRNLVHDGKIPGLRKASW